MNEIKVTVTYDKPTTSKFDALMAEYEAAKRCADETVAYYKPLADAAESAKFDAILEQLETIQEYAKRISEINNEAVWISRWIGARRFDVVYRPKEITHRYEITWGGDAFTKEKANRMRHLFYDGFNIIGRWEELKVYEQLQAEAFALLQEAIDKQKQRGSYQQYRLNNITKGGN